MPQRPNTVIRACFVLSDEYYRASTSAITRLRKPILRCEPYLGAAVFGVGVGAAWMVPGFQGAGLLASVIGLAGVVRRPIARYCSLRAWRRHHSIGGEVVIEFREEGIWIKSPATEGMMPWSAPLDVVADRKGLLITIREGIHHFIPESAFAAPTDIETVAAAFEAHGVRARRDRRNHERSQHASSPGNRPLGTGVR